MNRALIIAGALASVFGFYQQAIGQETFFERVKITAPDAADGDGFGHDVSLDANLLIVGAPMDDDNGSNSGSAYVIDTNTGAVLRKLLSGFFGGSNFFGDAVALQGDRAIVGIPNAFRTGAAALFDINGNEIDLLEPFSPPDASTDLSNFGFSVDFSNTGNNMVIGARSDTGQSDAGSNGGGGAMYIYNGAGAVTKVFASDASFRDNFGHSVAVSESFAVGSSPFDSENGVQFGSIYVFEVTSGTELRKIVPLDVMPNDFFGWQVAINGSVIAAGAPFHDAAGPDAGGVYIFDALSGEQLSKFTLPGTRLFGITLDLDGDRLAVGSEGRAHVFNIDSGELLAELLPSDASGTQAFGGSISIDGDTVVVGAQNDSSTNANAGAVYVYDLSGELPPIDPPGEDPQTIVSVQSIEAAAFTIINRRGVVRQGAEITVSVVNGLDEPVVDAMVSVETTGRIREVLSGTTDANGMVTLRSERTRKISRRPLTYNACVVDIEGDFEYDPEANEQTCASR